MARTQNTEVLRLRLRMTTADVSSTIERVLFAGGFWLGLSKVRADTNTEVLRFAQDDDDRASFARMTKIKCGNKKDRCSAA